MYIPRIATDLTKKHLSYFPVVGITGPRQSGKSTLLQESLPDYEYVTFDDQRIVGRFYDDPEGFMADYANKVIFDEVQKAPEIFHHIKLAVDQDRKNYGKYVVTGSCQFSFIEKITESLAGRIGLLTLLPLQYSEIVNASLKPSLYQGAYPELVQRHYIGYQEWYASYLETYLARDLRDLIQVADLRDFRRFIQLLASNAAQEFNMSTYAKDIGVTVQTIKRWVSVLEACYIVFLLPPYYENFGKRITKRPKLYFYDVGLVAYLMGIETGKQASEGPFSGSLFENYVVSEIMKKELHHNTHGNLYYLRTSNGEEIDLIVDRKSQKYFIEIKKSQSFKPAMIKTLEKFRSEKDKCYLLYQGINDQYKDTNILNYQSYLIQPIDK